MILEEYCRAIDPDQARAIHAQALLSAYRAMVRIRMIEERIGELVEKGEIICPCHLYIGQEAVAVGVCAFLRQEDYVFSTHRSHGHYLAKGGSVSLMMAELYGRATGCSSTRGCPGADPTGDRPRTRTRSADIRFAAARPRHRRAVENRPRGATGDHRSRSGAAWRGGDGTGE